MHREPNPIYERYQIHTLVLLITMLAAAMYVSGPEKSSDASPSYTPFANTLTLQPPKLLSKRF